MAKHKSGVYPFNKKSQRNIYVPLTQPVEKVRLELGFFDRLKQAKDTLLGLLFHKLRSCGIAARKAGGKKGDELRGMRLALQRTPRYRPQRSPVCFPDQIHRKADAALYIKAAGVIVLRDRRIQPSLGKHRPIRFRLFISNMFYAFCL